MNKCVIDNVKYAVEEGKGGILDKAVDYILKWQDLSEKYPALRPLQSILRNREHIENKRVNEYVETGKDFYSLDEKDTDILARLMKEQDKYGVRISEADISKPFKLDGEVIQLNDAQIKAYNSYRNTMDNSFKNLRMTEVNRLAYKDKQSIEAMDVADKDKLLEENEKDRLHKESLLDNFIDKARNSKTNSEILKKINADSSLTRNDRIFQKDLLRNYKSGYMERNRGEGTHAIEIRDSTGKLIHKEKFNPYTDLNVDREKMRADAIAEASKQLEETKAQNVSMFEKTKAKIEKQRDEYNPANNIDKKSKLEARRNDLANRASKLSGREKKFYMNEIDIINKKIDALGGGRIESLNKRIKIYEDRIAKEKSRHIKPEGVFEGKMSAEDAYGTKQDLQSAIRQLDAERRISIERKKNALIAQGMKGDILKNELEKFTKAFDESAYSIRSGLIDAAKAQSFQRHSIHRSKEYISGVKIDNIKEGLLKYSYQASAAEANIVTSMEAFDEIANLSSDYLRKIGTGKLNEVMRSSTDIEKIANKIAGMNFSMQFALNPASGIINLIGNHANFSSVLMDKGLTSVEANKLMAKSNAQATKFMSKFFTEYASNKTSFADFVKSYDFGSDLHNKTMIKAVADGLTFDVTMKDFDAIGGVASKTGKVVNALNLSMSQTERLNRVSTILASVDMAERDGNKYLKQMIDEKYIKTTDAYGNKVSYEDTVLQMADQLSSDINAAYGKLNRSQLESGSDAKGVLVRTLFPFQSYGVHQLALYGRYMQHFAASVKNIVGGMDKNSPEYIRAMNGARAFVNMNAWLGATGGLGAVGITNAMAYIEGEITGEPTFIEEAKMKDDMLSKALGYGIPSMLGIDVTGSMQMQLPYIGSYMMSRYNQSDTIQQLVKGNIHQALADNMFMPAIGKNLDKAIYDTDLLTKSGGKETINDEEVKRELTDSIAKVFGINTTDISEKKEIIHVRKGLDTWVADQKKVLNYKYQHDELDDDELERFNDRLDMLNNKYGTSYQYNPSETKDKEYTLMMDGVELGK